MTLAHNPSFTPAPAPATPDLALMLLPLALLLVGLVAITSASIEYAEWQSGNLNAWYYSQRHLIYLVLGALAAAASYRVQPQFWQASSWWWLFAALLLLIVVLIPGVGREVNGSQRWLPLGPFSLQPS
ncbi:MAG TPA: FtsW/RodA/SpoVE family cell cycle protein, partial [Halioglobus sp.]